MGTGSRASDRRLLQASSLTAFAMSLCGCAAASDTPDVARAHAAIVSGTLDLERAGVVGIVDRDGRLGCTGTLIAPSVVVTAAHCFRRSPAAAVILGARPLEGGERIEALRTVIHPTFDSATGLGDVAIVLLASRASAQSVPIEFELPRVGDALRVVGFGVTGENEPIARRTGVTKVESVGVESFRVAPSPSLPCNGDSGGPVLRGNPGAERLIGVISNGDTNCAEYADIQALVGLRAFVGRYLPASAALGDLCHYDENCASGLCQPSTLAELGYCSRTCVETADCATGMFCEPSHGQTRCLYRDRSPGALGFPCEEHRDCDRGMCAAPATGESPVCSALCFEGEPEPAGFACRANPDRPGELALFAAGPQELGGGGCSVVAHRSLSGRAALLALLPVLMLMMRGKPARSRG